MAPIRSRLLFVTSACALVLASCGGPERTGDPPPEGAERRASDESAAPTCMPGGLEAARPVEIVRLPAGCSFGPAGRLDAPLVISDAAALAGAITCPSGTAPPALDLATDDVLLVSFTMSPAYGGMGIFDDGTRVTFVMRDRPPCPGDPLPMPTPMSSSVAFRLPRGASRAYREASCSLPRRCD